MTDTSITTKLLYAIHRASRVGDSGKYKVFYYLQRLKDDIFVGQCGRIPSYHSTKRKGDYTEYVMFDNCFYQVLRSRKLVNMHRGFYYLYWILPFQYYTMDGKKCMEFYTNESKLLLVKSTDDVRGDNGSTYCDKNGETSHQVELFVRTPFMKPKEMYRALCKWFRCSGVYDKRRQTYVTGICDK